MERMKSCTLAVLLFVGILIQGCALGDIPQPGENRASCGGVCTEADRDKAEAAKRNALAWIGLELTILIIHAL